MKTKFIRYFLIFLFLTLVINGLLLFKSSTFFQFKKERTIESLKPPLIVAGGVVPHHLLAHSLIKTFFQKLATYSSIENIIVFAPDHYLATQKNNALFLTAYPISDLNINQSFVNYLLKLKTVKLDAEAISKDQGITSLKEYLNQYFPKSFVIPILISPYSNKEDIKQLVDYILKLPFSNTIIISSVDFSHYLNKEILNLHDTKSIRVLLNFEEESFPFLEVDSWQALFGLRYFAKIKSQEKPIIIGHKNSFDFFPELPLNSQIKKEGGTSYFSVIFEKGNFEPIEQYNLFIVGDIMMGRGVQILTDKYGLNYPFEKISLILKGLDLVIGNLEGPLLKDAPFISLKSVSFGYPLEVGGHLKKLGFNVLTLSNNHSLDKGKEALENTRSFLKEIGIVPLGDYFSCKKDYYYSYKNLLFIGANLVYQNENCLKEVIENLKEIKKQNPKIFIIFIPHWGTEYVHFPNEFQKRVAHQLIDNGIDLIIGHHPHVVQAIEEYKNKLIFYSLGNFVFDMYFSEATQKELGLGLTFKENEVIIYLIPFKSKKSQLYLLEDKEKESFLEWLSKISSSSLEEQIKSGQIIQNIKN